MTNKADTVQIAKFKYPPAKNTTAFMFDLSSCHKAFAENTLNVNRMNVCMRNTVRSGHVPRQVDNKGMPKEVQHQQQHNGDDMRTMLSFHVHFQNEKTLVGKFITKFISVCTYQTFIRSLTPQVNAYS